MTGWLVLAALADSITFLLMGTAHEANPIARTFPEVALAAKALLVLFVLCAPLGRYRGNVAAFGAGYFLAGALSNLVVMGVV
jgi:hypothetical protein